jgi:rhodanese-related sulfurtransferase
MTIKTTLKVLGVAVAFVAASQASADGNRYDRDRYYHSEISVAQAYLWMEHSKDFNNVPGQAKPVLIDVRTLREYAGGHPEDAYNVPFPNITGLKPEVTQKPIDFYWMVHDLVNGRTDAPIMLLCRTGSRSIAAGNILANPGEVIPEGLGVGLKPFTNVRNVWEGFVGQPLYAFDGSTIKVSIDENGELAGPYELDLNNDGVVNVDTADVHVETKDANPDKDGWRNFAGLPWTTKIRKPLAYERDPGLYKALNLTPVQ